jgi:phosphate butyryltransferase
MTQMLKSFDEIRDAATARGPKRLAVAGAADPELLTSLARAAELGLVIPTVVGDDAEMSSAAAAAGVDLSSWTVVAEPDAAEVPLVAAELVRTGSADFLIKGNTSTAAFMRAVLDAQRGLRGDGLMSHVFVTESARLGRLLLVTDGGINIAPSLEDKAMIVRNALPLARALGLDEPRVAVLAAVEKVNSKMPETEDAAKLVELNAAGALSGCIVAGPYAVDNAICPQAAASKGITGPVAGQADVILVPSVLVGNTFCKGITYFAGESCGGYVAGARAPVVFLSRADDVETRINSMALGVLMSGRD